MRKLCVTLLIIPLILTFFGCKANELNNDKISIVTTNFPAYDFARQICGETADITLLIKPGSESHNYDPTPKDILLINNCDIFIYNGGESENWVNEITEEINYDKTIAFEMMSVVKSIKTDNKVDEHIWTSPVNAIKIVDAICEKLCIADPDNAVLYKSNKEFYNKELNNLNKNFEELLCDFDEPLIFADRFPFAYFAKEYDVKYISAFEGCHEESEPTAHKVAEIIDVVDNLDIKYVFVIEFSNEKVADTVCSATGAQKLLFHSCHNVSADDFQSGVTYLDLMKQNLKNLQEAVK